MIAAAAILAAAVPFTGMPTPAVVLDSYRVRVDTTQ